MGKHLRPTDEPTRETIARLRSEGHNWDHIAVMYGVSGPTMRKHAAHLQVDDMGCHLAPVMCLPSLQLAQGVELPKARCPLLRESDMRAFLASLLTQNGWIVRPEVHVSHGRADILASKGGAATLIEIKLGDVVACAQAVGQVLIYAQPYPHFIPIVAVPVVIARDVHFAAMCKRVGVEVWAIENQPYANPPQ